MKRKFFSILFTLVLVCSMGLVFATPMGATTPTGCCEADAPDFTICLGTPVNDALFTDAGAGCIGDSPPGCVLTLAYGAVDSSTVGSYSYDVTCDDGICSDADSGTVTVKSCIDVNIIECPGCTDCAEDPRFVGVCTNFGIKAEITNNNLSAQDVTATCALGCGAEFVAPSDADIDLGTMEPGEMNTVAWMVHCVSEGDTVITVDTDHYINYVGGTDSCLVHQIEGPTLTVTVTAPCEVCTNCAPDNAFQVNASVKNDGDIDASNVRLIISKSGAGSADIIGSTERWIGDLAAGDTEFIATLWDVNCTAEGKVTFTATATGDNACTDEALTGTYEDTADVEQEDVLVDVNCVIGLKADWEALSGWGVTPPPTMSAAWACTDTCPLESDVISGDATLGQYVAITSRVVNCTDQQKDLNVQLAPPTNTVLGHVKAHVVMPGAGVDMYATVVTANWTVPIDDLCGCCYAEITWILQCTGESAEEDVVVNVTETSPGSGTWSNAVCDKATIEQEDKAHLATVMTAYVEGCDYDGTGDRFTQPVDTVAVGQDFDALITISNSGNATAENVMIDVTVTGPTDCSESWDDVSFGTIPGNDSESMWLSDLVTPDICQCTGEGQVRVAIDNIGGEDENTCEPIHVDNIDPVCPLLINQCDFGVELINPVTCENITYGDPFAVKAMLTNCGICDLYNVDVTLNWKDCGDVTLYDGSSANQTIAEILHNPCGTCEEMCDPVIYEVTWMVECLCPGDVTFWVCAESATQEGEGPHLLVKSNEATIHQKVPADLDVEILSPRGLDSEFKTSGNATAEWSTYRAQMGNYSAKMHAGFTGTDWAQVVLAPPAAPITLADMATITSGWSWFYYIATADFNDYGTQLELRFESTTGDGYAEMTIMDKAYGNPGAGLVPTLDAWAEQTILGATTTGLVFGMKEDGTTGISEFPVGHEGTIASLVAEMNTQTTGSSDAWVLTEVRPGLGWIPNGETTAYIDTVTIEGLTYDLEPLGTYVATSQDFAVTARVTNTGSYPADNVAADIGFGPLAGASVPTATIPIGTMAAGAVEIITWTVHCDASGITNITVTADADNLSSPAAAAIVAVEQYPAAHLEVQGMSSDDYTVTVSENFTVTADIFNTGEADAWEVTATLSVFPEGSARVVDGGYTKTVGDGTLVGHGQDGNAEVSWTLHCKEACESTITITVEGFDEYGWHLKQSPTTGETILVDMPGRAIDDRFIEPASVTVKQEAAPTEADLALTKVVDATEPVVLGSDVTFTVTVTNNGPADATSIMVWDQLSAGLNLQDCTPSPGWYYVAEGYWSVGDLAVGETATLEIVAKVNTVGDIYNSAVISYCDQHDPNIDNDTDYATVTGVAPEAVTEATINVDAGYNLISLPLIPDAPAINTMTADLEPNLVKVRNYDAAAGWLVYDPAMPFPSGSTLLTMDDGWGYWVKMVDPGAGGSFTFDGSQLVAGPEEMPPSYDVVEGWNLIGFKSTVPKLPENYLAGIADKYVMIYGFANGSFFIAGTPGHDMLQSGQGYWIAMIAPGTIYP